MSGECGQKFVTPYGGPFTCRLPKEHSGDCDDAQNRANQAAPAREPEAAQCPYVTYFSGGAYASCILDAGHGGGHKNHSFYNVSANAVWELEREKEISERPGLLATMESLRARVSQLEQELAEWRKLAQQDGHFCPPRNKTVPYPEMVCSVCGNRKWEQTLAERDALREALRSVQSVLERVANPEKALASIGMVCVGALAQGKDRKDKSL